MILLSQKQEQGEFGDTTCSIDTVKVGSLVSVKASENYVIEVFYMKNTKNATVTLNLRLKMEEHNHSPQKLAELLEVSVQTVNGWLSKRKGISNKYGEKLEALYGETIETLLGEVDVRVEFDILQISTSIALQPTSDKIAQINFSNTIAQAVELSTIESHLTKEQFKVLSSIYPDGKAFIWGTRDGKGPNMPTRMQYSKLKLNDIVLFYQEGRFYAKSRVTYLLSPNQSLSAQLWNGDDTFSNIYFIKEAVAFNLDVIQFNKIVYNKEQKFPVMGFKVLDAKQSLALIKGLELDSIEDYPNVEEVLEHSSAENEDLIRKKLLEMLTKLESKEALTTDSKGQGRAEQHILRVLLYGKKKTSVCECCKKEFPVSYMKTAHIKKRKFTNNEEKLDVNIVFALCPMCDIAFENGDIYVDEGYFKVTSKPLPKDLSDYIDVYDNTICSCYNEKNEQYFKWHKEHHLIKIPN